MNDLLIAILPDPAAVAHMVLFALAFALLHHERWRRPAAREVWDMRAAWCRSAPQGSVGGEGSA